MLGRTAPSEGSTERGFEHGGLEGPWPDLGVGARYGVCCEGIRAKNERPLGNALGSQLTVPFALQHLLGSRREVLYR